MAKFTVETIYTQVDARWWQRIMKRFVQPGDSFEIRCWQEEENEISAVMPYGRCEKDNMEVSVKGVMTRELLEDILVEPVDDKAVYNKMTKFFTVNVKNQKAEISSCHYGTQMYIDVFREEDINFLKAIVDKYPDSLSFWEY